MPPVTATYRIAEAAALLGVSDDTVRRWIDSRPARAARDAGGPARGRRRRPGRRRGAARTTARARARPPSSARNRLRGHRHARRPGHRDGAGRDPGRAVPAGLADVAGRRPTSSGLEVGVRAGGDDQGHPGQRGRPVRRRCARIMALPVVALPRWPAARSGAAPARRRHRPALGRRRAVGHADRLRRGVAHRRLHRPRRPADGRQPRPRRPFNFAGSSALAEAARPGCPGRRVRLGQRGPDGQGDGRRPGRRRPRDLHHQPRCSSPSRRTTRSGSSTCPGGSRASPSSSPTTSPGPLRAGGALRRGRARSPRRRPGISPDPDTYEDDVRAALTKVELGEVDAALVYASDVVSAGRRSRASSSRRPRT